ncbi:MAG TPA: heparinase II/III family protein [Paenirhodobacter sp.]
MISVFVSTSDAPGGDTLHGRLAAVLNRLAAHRAARSRVKPGFARRPEPRDIGSLIRGQQLIGGTFQFADALIQAPAQSIWDLPIPDPALGHALHGFSWLDDLAAVGDAAARARAQVWTFDWIARYGLGKGPGWAPDMTGRRLIRLVNNAPMVLNGRDAASRGVFMTSLAQQVVFLSRRWPAATCGIARIEALTGLIHAALSLDGMARLVPPAMAALARECHDGIDAHGALPARNPEELLEVLTLLVRASEALCAADIQTDPAIFHAIARIAPTLRALRHADGGLPRFHGGGCGAEGRLDAALAASGIRTPAGTGLAMGYARLQGGQTSVIIDAAPPPRGASSVTGHASTLAFEMTSGRVPVVVSCGSGAPFGADWHRASRATASHSTLEISGYSSSRLGPEQGGDGARTQLDETPQEVWMRTDERPGRQAIFGHDGYVCTHGLHHIRDLDLSADGRVLRGTDTLGTMSSADRAGFDTVAARAGSQGIGFRLRFHLHPDIDAQIDMGGWAVSLALPSGEIWVLRFKGPVDLTLAPSVYLESGGLGPRPSRQIVLSGHMPAQECQIVWTLERAQDTPATIRDSDTTVPQPDI